MVETQMRDREIDAQKVLAAISKVPHHEFLDSWCQDLANVEHPLRAALYQSPITKLFLSFISSPT